MGRVFQQTVQGGSLIHERGPNRFKIHFAEIIENPFRVAQDIERKAVGQRHAFHARGMSGVNARRGVFNRQDLRGTQWSVADARSKSGLPEAGERLDKNFGVRF